jgi:hypothetical protein
MPRQYRDQDPGPSSLYVEPLEDRMMLATVQVIAAGVENTESMQPACPSHCNGHD